jgi:hypothetical protein
MGYAAHSGPSKMIGALRNGFTGMPASAAIPFPHKPVDQHEISVGTGREQGLISPVTEFADSDKSQDLPSRYGGSRATPFNLSF